MSQFYLIRCRCNNPLEDASSELGELLNVVMSSIPTEYGVSYHFRSLGLRCAFYNSPIGDYVKDRRLEEYPFVLSVTRYARLTGRMYSEIHAIFEMALFIASVITAELEWGTFVCTEENIAMEQIDP